MRGSVRERRPKSFFVARQAATKDPERDQRVACGPGGPPYIRAHVGISNISKTMRQAPPPTVRRQSVQHEVDSVVGPTPSSARDPLVALGEALNGLEAHG
jgi:hypothetical protein